MDHFLKRKVDVGENPVPVKVPTCVVRKYEPDYNKFGFITAGSDVDLGRWSLAEVG